MGVAIDLLYRAVTTGSRVGLYCVGHYSTYYKPMGLYCVVQYSTYYKPMGLYCVVHYSTYYKLKPMDDLSSEQGGLIIRTELIYEYTTIQASYTYTRTLSRRGGGLIIHHGLIIRTIPTNVFVIIDSHSNLYRGFILGVNTLLFCMLL